MSANGEDVDGKKKQFRTREGLSKEELLRRRAVNAERQRRRRQNLSEEQKEQRRAKDREQFTKRIFYVFSQSMEFSSHIRLTF